MMTTLLVLLVLQTPELKQAINFGLLFNKLKSEYAMILIGLSHFKNGDDMRLNPDSNSSINSGDYLHYIANERIQADEIDWNRLQESAST